MLKFVGFLLCLSFDLPIAMGQTVTIDPNVKKQTINTISGNLAKNCFAFRFWPPTDSTTDMIDPVGHRFLNEFKPEIVRVALPVRQWVGGTNAGNLAAWVKQCRTILSSGAKLIAFDQDMPSDCAVNINPQGSPQPGLPDSQMIFERQMFASENVGIAKGRLSAYGQHLIDFIKWAKSHGIEFLAVSRSEPNGNWPTEFQPAELAALMIQVNHATGQKWLAGDCNAPDPTPKYVAELLSIPGMPAMCIAISFHSYWSDPSRITAMPSVLNDGNSSAYQDIATLGAKYGLPVWVTEQAIGNQQIDRGGWLYAMATAENFWRCVAFADASAVFYWEYQAGDNYTPSDGAARSVYPVWDVEKSLHDALPRGTVMIDATADTSDIGVLAGLLPKTAQLSLVLLNLTNGKQLVTVKSMPPGSYSEIQRTRAGVASSTLTIGADSVLPLPAMSVSILSSRK
jgi:O-glycosyl hydrolase